MFWFVWEWAWEIGHFIFFGLWYAVLIAIGIGLIHCRRQDRVRGPGREKTSSITVITDNPARPLRASGR